MRTKDGMACYLCISLTQSIHSFSQEEGLTLPSNLCVKMLLSVMI